jgi:alcohol oxidase
LGFFSHYPLSRGSIHITSADDVYASPDFNTGFFSNSADIAPLIWAYKKGREIVRRMDCFRGEVCQTHPPFPPESAAACLDAYDPDVKDIAYSEADDEILNTWIRGLVGTTWHPMYVHTLVFLVTLIAGELVR